MKSSISIVLFFLLSGFFLSALLGALDHSRKLLGIAAACFVAVACVIAFLTPIHLPSWRLGSKQGGSDSTVSTMVGTTVSTAVSTTMSTAVSTTAVTEALSARSR